LLQTISVNALCFVQVLSNKCLNWPMTTRAHAPRQVSTAWGKGGDERTCQLICASTPGCA
jgi:hypothetical protein